MYSLKQTKHETQKQHSSRYADVTMIRHFPVNIEKFPDSLPDIPGRRVP